MCNFMKGLLLIVLLGFTQEMVKAQTPTPPPPDCVMFISFGATGTGGTFDNRFTACDTWTMSYQASSSGGTISSLTLVLQSAQGATAAGTFGNFAGTAVNNGCAVSGCTSTTGALATYANGTVSIPWVRVKLTLSATGTATVNGTVYGYRTGSSGSATGPGTGGCVGTVGTPCIVAGPVAAGSAVGSTGPVQVGITDGTNVRRPLGDSSGRQVVIGAAATGAAVTGAPVLVGGNDGTNAEAISVDTSGRPQLAGTSTAMADGISNTEVIPNANAVASVTRNFPFRFNGGTWDRQYGCSSTVIIDDSSSGNTQIIALSGSTQIRICKATFSTAGSVSIQLTQGTGSNCASGTANLSLLYQSVLGIAEDYMTDSAPLVAAAGNAVCLNLSASTRTTGQVWYSQF